MSNIEKYFAGKSVLVTGATGFVGKVLVEKLLRSIELIQCVYIIIRTKRDGKAKLYENKSSNSMVRISRVAGPEVLEVHQQSSELHDEIIDLNS